MSELASVFDPDVRRALGDRISTLRPDSPRQWGKMTPVQMLDHCASFDRWVQSGGAKKQEFVGKIVGRALLRRFMRPGNSLPKNVPTLTKLIGRDLEDFEATRQAWLTSLAGYSDYQVESFVHDFFGPMTREEVGLFVHKHADHHLKQFGV
ncbi:MAG: DinB family protein [Trueperaceae bacterium]|nr:DinB family protein [Trueperaceae bacterium]